MGDTEAYAVLAVSASQVICAGNSICALFVVWLPDNATAIRLATDLKMSLVSQVFHLPGTFFFGF